MVIFDLRCEFLHEFEGWFKNSEELLVQQQSGLLTCPFCDSSNVTKKVTASKVGRKSNAISSTATDSQRLERATDAIPSSLKSNELVTGEASAQKFAELQNMLAKVHDYVDANFQDVGNRFADEAISMHHGDKEVENIKGTVNRAQMEQLVEEGVQALPLPPKPIDKKKIN